MKSSLLEDFKELGLWIPDIYVYKYIYRLTSFALSKSCFPA